MKAILISVLLVLSAFTSVACTGEPPKSGGAVVPTPQPPDASAPAPAPSPEAEKFDWLVDVMAVLPASVADSGVWFSNPAPALALAGVEPATTTEEWTSWTDEQRRAYWDARAGIPGSGIHYTMRQSGVDWDETFGFGAWDVVAMAETGEMEWSRFQFDILLGSFDPIAVNQKLSALGYVKRSHPDGEYLGLPGEIRLATEWLRPIVVNSHMRNVLVQEQTVITAPSEEKMQEVLSARAGESPSLMDHVAFGDLASLAPDPLFAVILDRQVVPPAEGMGVGPPREQPEEWGEIGNWEALSGVFSRPSPELKRIAYSLWYAGLEEAQEDAAELSRRFNPPEPSELRDELFIYEYCAFWQIEALSTPNGAVVEIACQIEAGEHPPGLGALMHSALVSGLLEFMIG